MGNDGKVGKQLAFRSRAFFSIIPLGVLMNYSSSQLARAQLQFHWESSHLAGRAIDVAKHLCKQRTSQEGEFG